MVCEADLTDVSLALKCLYSEHFRTPAFSQLITLLLSQRRDQEVNKEKI